MGSPAAQAHESDERQHQFSSLVSLLTHYREIRTGSKQKGVCDQCWKAGNPSHIVLPTCIRLHGSKSRLQRSAISEVRISRILPL
jgi:hypothetical protein